MTKLLQEMSVTELHKSMNCSAKLGHDMSCMKIFDELASRLERANADNEAVVSRYRNEREYENFLHWRGVSTELGDKPCKKCNGSGLCTYSSTSTWHGGIGGQALTSAVCDLCWGSGKENKPWANLRELESKIKLAKQAGFDECREKAATEAVDDDTDCPNSDNHHSCCAGSYIELKIRNLKMGK